MSITSDTQNIQGSPTGSMIPFLLTCMLIGLKITGHLDIPWLVAFIPVLVVPIIYLVGLLLFGILLVAFLIAGVVWVLIETVVDLFRTRP